MFIAKEIRKTGGSKMFYWNRERERKIRSFAKMTKTDFDCLINTLIKGKECSDTILAAVSTKRSLK